MENKCDDSVNKLLAVWLLIHELADDVIRDFIERSREKPEKERTLLEELITEVAEQKDKLRENMNDVTDVVSSSGLATKKEMEQLFDRLDRIENTLAK